MNVCKALRIFCVSAFDHLLVEESAIFHICQWQTHMSKHLKYLLLQMFILESRGFFVVHCSPNALLRNIIISWSEIGLELFRSYLGFLWDLLDCYTHWSWSDICWLTTPGEGWKDLPPSMQLFGHCLITISSLTNINYSSSELLLYSCHGALSWTPVGKNRQG